MDNTREEVSKVEPITPGLKRDVKRLAESSSGAIQELREFVASLKGRSPQEVLGVVASSDLTKGIIQATLGCALLLVVLTVIPYAMADAPSEEQSATANATSPDGAGQEAQAATTAKSNANVAANAVKGDQSGGDVLTDKKAQQAQAAKAMGIDKVKDPDKAPLDSQLDKLLDIE